MIDTKNDLKTLSMSLLNAVRGVMEASKEAGTPMTAKQKELAAKAPPHDKITHADVLVGRGVLKKHPTTGKLVTKEEVEDLEELSKGKLTDYRAAAKKQGTGIQDKMKMGGGDWSKDGSDTKTLRKRMAGYNMAGRKANPDLAASVGKAPRVAATEEVQIDELSTDTMNNYARERSRTAFSGGRKPGESVDDGIKRKSRQINSLALSKTKINRVRDTGSTVLSKEEVELDEALDAAARYGHHHVAIKELLKSIDQHVKNHKDDALKHRDYKGKKGVTWGHVGDIAQVHATLADIHDRLAQQGEYKMGMSESLDEKMSDEAKMAIRGAVKAGAKARPLVSLASKFGKKQTKEEAELDEAHKINDRVEIVRGSDKGIVGHIGEIRRGPYKGAPNTYTVYHGEHGATQVKKEHIRAIKEEAELDEARGRPRKNPLPAGQEAEPEPRQHVMQQLQRAKLSMRGGEHVTFKDGTKHHVTGAQAAKILTRYAGMKPADKEDFQKKIGASHSAFKDEL
jgi:hypothetical protein